ncbi:MAG: hypothetical protein HZA58_04720 [Acidimicrobiia bacterium]|nr:hypothetical protein [Acidimicrobiia bacterium]
MRRLEKKLFAITDEIDRLRETVRQTEEEWYVLQHLDDDAQRDAAVGGPIDRDDARQTARDVARFQQLITELRRRLTHLEAKRVDLLNRLGSTG